jgi:glutamyl-tRNA synthetase
MEKIVVRIAPSPTGNLHIGTARTALFNFLFARQNNGTFIVRIEDTDKERSKKEYEDNILDGFKWLGISHDAFYRQSEREEIYKSYLKKLIEDGYAYISKEEVTEEGKRSEVIRFKNPNTKISFFDLIRGEVVFDTTDLGDFVIARSETEPLYHLAVVIDDHEMGVTHVIRGEDHISNTPRQILILEAIGASRPIYGHIPLILGPDRSKMSKRHGATSIAQFRDRGYLPEAIVNYLALLGWNPGTEKEIFDIEELIKIFDVKKIQKGGAIFDEEKLKWVNKEHIKKIPLEQTLPIIKEIIESSLIAKENSWNVTEDILVKIQPIILERINRWQDITDMLLNHELDYFFIKPVYKTESFFWKGEKNIPDTVAHLENVVSTIKSISNSDWNSEYIKNSIWDYATEKGRGSVLWPFRYALSGKEKSPDPFILAGILGKEESVLRLKASIELLRNEDVQK